jgi:hypothetical protein
METVIVLEVKTFDGLLCLPGINIANKIADRIWHSHICKQTRILPKKDIPNPKIKEGPALEQKQSILLPSLADSLFSLTQSHMHFAPIG